MSRVLVVDDDLAVLAAMEIMLRRDGHTAVLVESGRAAVRMLERESFGLLICDVFMPEMDGFEFVRVVRRQAPSLPIIAMSGHSCGATLAGPSDFLDMATKLGAKAALRKPFGHKDLADAIGACVGSGGGGDTGTPPRGDRE